MKSVPPDSLTNSAGETIKLREAEVLASVREITASFLGFRELMEERNARYQERSDANKAALAVALTTLAHSAEELKENLREYKASANEWRAASKDLIENMPSNKALDALDVRVALAISGVDTRLTDAVKTIGSTVDTAVKNINTQLNLLQRSDILTEGRKEQRGEGRVNINQFVGVVVGVLMALLAFWLRNKP